MSEEFLLLRDVIYEHAGLSFDGDAMFLFDRRLGERVEALGLRSFNDYYKYLRFNSRGPAELEEAIVSADVTHRELEDLGEEAGQGLFDGAARRDVEARPTCGAVRRGDHGRFVPAHGRAKV